MVRTIRFVSFMLTVALVATSFALSFTALSTLASEYGLTRALSNSWALLLDGGALVAMLSSLAAELSGRNNRLAKFGVYGFTALSVLANAYHALAFDVAGILVHTLPPIVVFVSFELLVGDIGHAARQAAKLSTARSELSTLAGQLSTVNSELSAARAELSAHRSELSDLTGQLSAVRVELDAAFGQLSTARSELSDLAGQRKDALDIAKDARLAGRDERQSKARALHGTGEPVDSIAAQIGVSVRTVKRYLELPVATVAPAFVNGKNGHHSEVTND